MNETVGQGGGMAALPPRGIGEILSAEGLNEFELANRPVSR